MPKLVWIRTAPFLATDSMTMVRSPQFSMLLILLCFSPSVTTAAEGVVDDPYFVFVANDASYLRCGPSQDDYRTEPLRHGQELEVYVETAEGWLGVRPTDDSFCWVVADAVKLEKTSPSKGGSRGSIGKGTVTENQTVAWIGTNLGRARSYRWQVRLSQGEPVTVLGSSVRDGAEGPQTWYRIVPPSGEFRWVHRDQVVTTAEALLATASADSEPVEFLPDGQSFAEAPRKDPQLEEIIARRERRQAEQSRDRLAGWRTDSVPEVFDEALTEVADQEFRHDDAGHSHAHQPQSFSQRVVGGLSVLVGGRDASMELQPVTPSSRRVPDLVPIATSPTVVSANPNSIVGSGAVTSPGPVNAPEMPGRTPTVTLPSNGPVNLAASPNLVNLAATPVPAAPLPLPSLSELAITSRPRLVPQTSTIPMTIATDSRPSDWGVRHDGFAQSSPTSPPRTFAPPSVRTISETQLTDLRTQIASSDASGLALLLSRSMSRAASAPEMELIALAATERGDMALAARAREYESLARRRDGETYVAAATLSAPVVAAPSIPPKNFSGVAMASATLNVHEKTTGGFSQREVTTPAQPIASTIGPPPASPAHQGMLIEVYSADPSRPPFALTDRAGRTLAYITPGPGVSMKSHLGSMIRVTGQSGFLQGLDTPHILATSAERIVQP